MRFEVIFSRRFFVLTFLYFLLAARFSFGQGLESRTDTIRLDNDHFIQKIFQHSISGNDTILEGRYRLLLKPDVSGGLQARPYDFAELEANFRRDQKQGDFFLREVSMHPAIDKLYPENEYVQIPYKGTISENQGQFEGDLPSGQWTFLQLEQSNAVTADPASADTVLQVRAFYGRQGILKDQYRIVDRKAAEVMVGSLDEEGNLDDALDVRSRIDGSVIIRFIFDNGLLTGINRPGERSLRPDYEGKVEAVSFEEKPLDSLYANIISYYLESLPGEEPDEGLRPLETVYKSFYFLNGKHSSLMGQLPGEQHFQLPKVKVPVFETTPEEEEIIRNKYNRLKALNQQMDSLMHVSAFTLNRYGDEKLASLYAQMQVVKRRLQRQKEFSELLKGPLLEHIGPDWFMQRRMERVERLDTATYTFNNQQFQQPMEFDFETEGLSAFEQYRSYINTLEETFMALHQQVAEHVEGLELDTRMTESEERLSDLSEEIDQLADTISLNMYRKQVSNGYKNSFVEFKDSLLAEYAGMNSRERLAALDEIVNCLKQLKIKLDRAQVLAERELIVDHAYMDRRLNPYTYTEVDVRLFEGLFSTYHDTLVPYLVNNMIPAQTCEDFLEKADNLKRLQDFMLQALEGNPRKLERRIRNIDDPEAIIKKLGVPVVL